MSVQYLTQNELLIFGHSLGGSSMGEHRWVGMEMRSCLWVEAEEQPRSACWELLSSLGDSQGAISILETLQSSSWLLLQHRAQAQAITVLFQLHLCPLPWHVECWQVLPEAVQSLWKPPVPPSLGCLHFHPWKWLVW